MLVRARCFESCRLLLTRTVIGSGLGLPTFISGIAYAQTSAAPEPAASDTVTAMLPRDLTPWGMFLGADVVVKAILIILAIASLMTWTIWLYKMYELWAARRQLAQAQSALAAARSLTEASTAASAASSHVAMLLQAVETE